MSERHYLLLFTQQSDFLYSTCKMGYTEDEKLERIRLFYKNNNNVAQDRAEYRRIHPEMPVPAIFYVSEEFELTGVRYSTDFYRSFNIHATLTEEVPNESDTF